MTEALERSVREHGVPVFDGYRVIKALTDGEKMGWQIKTVWGVGYKFEVK